MDPATAAITIVGAALTAAKFAKELYRAYDEFSMFDEDIETLAATFDTFAGTVETTELSFRTVCKEHPGLTVVGWITERGLVKNLGTMSRQIERRIQIARARFQHVARKEGLLSLGRKVWWTYRHKEDVEKLQPRMQILMQSLSLVCDAIQLNVTMTKDDTTHQLKWKIRKLKRILKKKEKIIKNLSLHHLLVQQQPTDAGRQHSSVGTSSETEVPDTTTEMLLELGQSLRRSETAADIGPQLLRSHHAATRRTTTRSSSRRRRRPPGPDPDDLISVNSGPPPGSPPPRTPPQLRRRRGASMIRPDDSTNRRPEPQAITIPEDGAGRSPPADYYVVAERQAARREEDEEEEEEENLSRIEEEQEIAMTDSTVGRSASSSLLTRETSSSSTAGRRTTTPETPVTPPAVVQDPPAPAAASSFEDVRERMKYHSLVGLRGATVQGYLGQAGGRREGAAAATPVTARRFGAAVLENFIGERAALELGLEIKPLDPEEEEEGDGGGGVVLVTPEGNRLVHKRAVGTVEATWWTAPHPQGLKLRMWALEGALPDGIAIALGRPYEKRRRHYNRAPSVE